MRGVTAEATLQGVASVALTGQTRALPERCVSVLRQSCDQLALAGFTKHDLARMLRQYCMRLGLFDAGLDRQALNRAPIEVVVLHRSDHALEHRRAPFLLRCARLRRFCWRDGPQRRLGRL